MCSKCKDKLLLCTKCKSRKSWFDFVFLGMMPDIKTIQEEKIKEEYSDEFNNVKKRNTNRV